MMTAAKDRSDKTGALRVGPAVLMEGAAEGPLAGTETVVKDLFDIAGQRTGAGNPDWLADAPVNKTTATAVRRLVNAGATIVGIAHTDELAFSLSGTNVHYGTPLNTKAPERVPGGSSSGPASAVAAGLVPYALGTDTGGSIRIPASYCGVFGYRPTWERPPKDGLVPLAPFFDTPGILAAEGRWLREAGRALLATDRLAPAATGLILVTDLVSLAEPEAAAGVAAATARLGLALGLSTGTVSLGSERLASWRTAFMARQMPDIWASHGAWVTRRRPSFGPGVTARMKDASQADPERGVLAETGRAEVRALVEDILPAGTVLALPSASGPAPLLDLDMASKAALRTATIAITCVAGLGGLPAVSLPLASVSGAPLGLCLVGRAGDDELLLELAARADALLAH